MPESFDGLHLASDRRLATTAAILSIVPVVWYVRTDLALYADDWPRLAGRLTLRVAVLILTGVVVWLLRSATTREAYSAAVLAYASGMAALILAINATRPGGSSLPLRMPLYLLSVMYGALPNRLKRQCVPPILFSLGLVALRSTRLTGVAENDIPGDLLIVAIVNVLGVLLVRRRLALEEDVAVRWRAEHEALDIATRSLAELRTLRGIIPICAHCKQVRTEIGDWEQVEKYVQDHSYAEFSHGICPACMTRHYTPRLHRKAGAS